MADTRFVNVSDYPSVHAAAADLSPDGGVLYFPPGHYSVGNLINIPSNTTVFGAGPASYVRRERFDPNTGDPLPPRSGTVFRCVGVHDVVFRDLAIDVNWNGGRPAGWAPDDPRLGTDEWNFRHAIDFGTGKNTETGEATLSENCVVDNVLFTSGDRPLTGQTQRAVVARNVRHLRVSNCRIIYMQIQAAAPGGPRRGPVTIIGNHFTDPYNFAVSFISSSPRDELENLIVSHNTIENVPSEGAIYVGTDSGKNRVAKLHNVHITGNQIIGTWGEKASFGIFVRLAADTQNILISDNIVRSTNTKPPDTRLIYFKAERGGALKHCVISGNIVENCDKEGISVTGTTIEGLHVLHNQVYASRGISIEPTSTSSDWIIANNYCAGRGHHLGIKVRAAAGEVRGVEIQGNVCKNNRTAGIQMEAAAGSTLHANVLGNKCYDDQTPKTQRYGLNATGPGAFDVLQSNNDLRENRTGPIGGGI